jgi:hypothetical protein
VIRPLPDASRKVLQKGVLCYLASGHRAGPHVTPVVFVLHGSSLWVTTSRSSAKARAWRRNDRVGGLVRDGDRAVSFAGRVTAYDLMNPATWPRSLRHAPSITRAAAVFTAKNARFFAGYAVDAYRVPLSWTPPGRVFAEISLDRLALIDGHGVRQTWGRFGKPISDATSFPPTHDDDPLSEAPVDVRTLLGDRGEATLAVHAGRVPVVVPCSWTTKRRGLFAVLPKEILGLAGGGPAVPASITIDHASQWRARAMAGLLVQGEATVHLVESLTTGAVSARGIAGHAGYEGEDAAVLDIRARRLVWWRGWDSGTVEIT